MHTRKNKNYKHQELRDYLLKCISTGVYKAGERIETEAVICEKFSLSRNTVRQAVKDLENAGYLTRLRGSGTYTTQKQPPRKIAFLVYSLDYVFYSVTRDVLRGIKSVLAEDGWSVDVIEIKSGFTKDKMASLINHYAGFLIGAYQLDMETLDILMNSPHPAVLVKNYPESLKDCAFRIDYERGGFLVAEHLIKSGRDNLALVYPGDNISISREFLEGIRHACLEYGARLKSENMFISQYTELANPPAVIDALCQSHRNGLPVTGVICATDSLACELCSGLTRGGIAVPEQIAVTGCNNAESSRFCIPSITTLDLPSYELGRAAAEAVMAGKTTASELAASPLVFEPRLVVRESTAGNSPLEIPIRLQT